MASIVFINPPAPQNRKITRNCDCASESKGNYLLQPFDFLYLSSKISPNVKFKFIDAVADKLSQEESLQLVASLKPTHIVSAIVDLCWDNDLEFIQKLKINCPDALLFTFGDALVEEENRKIILSVADGIIENAFLFDITHTLNLNRDDQALQSIAGLSKSEKRPGTNKTPNGIQFPFSPHHEQFKNINYRWPFSRHKTYTSIASNWGCPFACSYCIDSLFPFYYREAGDIIRELSELDKKKIKELVFTDKSFGHPRKNTFDFLTKMKDFKFSWSTYIHPLQCDKDLLKAMSEAGCHTIIIGVESNKPEQLKAFKRNTTNDQIQKAIDNAHAFNIDVCGDFLIGLPEQTYDDALQLINFSTDLGLDYASFNIVAPLPGSEIKKGALADGRMAISDHHYDSVGNFNILSTKLLNEKELKDLRKLANKKFYLRKEIFLKRVKRTKTIEHFLIQFKEGYELFFKR